MKIFGIYIGKTPYVIEQIQHIGCPCLYTNPCNPRCTCINGGSSFGCRRCATYGSLEQKTLKSQRLAEKIDEI